MKKVHQKWCILSCWRLNIVVSCKKCGSRYGNKETGYCRDCQPIALIRKGKQLARVLRKERLPTYQFNDLEKRHYVYICRCKDGTLYTGLTRDLTKRTTAHKEGNGARYTKTHEFDSLQYFELCADKTTAEQREREIKDKGTSYKHLLIKDFQTNITLLNIGAHNE